MDSTLILALIILLLGFAIVGATTRLKIFSLFSGIVSLALLLEFSSNTALVILFAGVFLFQAYYSFAGSRL